MASARRSGTFQWVLKVLRMSVSRLVVIGIARKVAVGFSSVAYTSGSFLSAE